MTRPALVGCWWLRSSELADATLYPLCGCLSPAIVDIDGCRQPAAYRADLDGSLPGMRWVAFACTEHGYLLRHDPRLLRMTSWAPS